MYEKKWLTIHFTDGTEMKFDFPHQNHDPSEVAAIVEKSVQSNQLILEAEGVMYMFPYTSIKYIRVSPCPDNLPDTALKNVNISYS